MTATVLLDRLDLTQMGLLEKIPLTQFILLSTLVLQKLTNPKTMICTITSSFLPVPDLMSETGTRAQEASTAEDASEMTQSAIEKMVNPSSLLSSAIDDIRQSGVSNTDASPQAQTAPNKTINLLNTEFSTIHLYGTDIPPKDYLVVSSDEESGDDKSKIFATARIPCNDKHETPLRVVLLENWSSIAYPPPKMQLIDGAPDGELCMYRMEYPDKEFAESYITPNIADKSSNPQSRRNNRYCIIQFGGISHKVSQSSAQLQYHIWVPHSLTSQFKKEIIRGAAALTRLSSIKLG